MKSTRFFSKQLALLLSALFVLSLSIGFTSCQIDDDDDEKTYSVELPSGIEGTWKSSVGDMYIIDEKNFYNTYSDKANAEYKFNNLEIVQLTGTTNPTYYLYCQSPETYTYSSEYAGVTYSGTYYTKDYYTAVLIEVVSSTTLKISCAYSSAGSENPSLDTVKSDFTVSGGYFSYQPEYTKQ